MAQVEESKIALLVCNSCYWIASLLDRRKESSNCPVCGHLLESLEIENNEQCSVEAADSKNGLVLEFQKSNAKRSTLLSLMTPL
jgi:hypothetical protein